MDLLSFTHLRLQFRFSRCNFLHVQNQSKLQRIEYGFHINAFAGKSQTKRSRKEAEIVKTADDLLPKDQVEAESITETSTDTVDAETSLAVPPRTFVLQACTVTSGFIGLLGVVIRQICQSAPLQEWPWPAFSCSTDIAFSFEPWHLGLVAGSVILVTTSRFVLLKTWPDFAESSRASNQQVLTSLEPLDYVVVAFLPAISEELLFRGALLPLAGANFTGILIVAALFGVLHLGAGRNYSFAIWATLVGLVYGYTTAWSTSVIVPMASHALNNLVAAVLWRYLFDETRLKEH